MVPSYLRWQSGDPSEFAVHPATLQPSDSINDRDRFACAEEVAAVARRSVTAISPRRPVSRSPRPEGSRATHVTRRWLRVPSLSRTCSTTTNGRRQPPWPSTWRGTRSGIALARSTSIDISQSDTPCEELRAHWDAATLAPAHELAERSPVASSRPVGGARPGRPPDAGHVVTRCRCRGPSSSLSRRAFRERRVPVSW